MTNAVFNTINQGTATLARYTGPSVFAQVADQLAPVKGWLGGSASPFPTLAAIEAIALGAAIHSNQARDDSYLYARVGAYALPFFLRQLVQALPTTLSFASGWYPIKDMGFDDLMRNSTYWLPSLVIYNLGIHFLAHRLCPKNKRGDRGSTVEYNRSIQVPMEAKHVEQLPDNSYRVTYAVDEDCRVPIPASVTIAPSGMRLFKSTLLATVAAATISHYTTPYLENPYIPLSVVNEFLGIASVAAMSKRKVMGGYLLTRALSRGIQELTHLAPLSNLNFSYLNPFLTIAKDQPQLSDLSIGVVKENPPLWIGSMIAYNIALYSLSTFVRSSFASNFKLPRSIRKTWGIRHIGPWVCSITKKDQEKGFVEVRPTPHRSVWKKDNNSDIKPIYTLQTFIGDGVLKVKGGGFFDTMKTHLYALSVGTAITIMLRHHWKGVVSGTINTIKNYPIAVSAMSAVSVGTAVTIFVRQRFREKESVFVY